MADDASAFDLLRSTRRLPVPESLSGRAQLAAAGAAWGCEPRRWRDASTGNVVGEGGDMPRELRTLVAASFSVYARVARLPRDAAPAELVRASREYREALKTCIFSLEDRLEQGIGSRDEEMKDGETAESDAKEEEVFVDLLKVALALWHLCELLLLQRGAWNDRWLAYDLAQWLQEHYASASMDRLEAESKRLRAGSSTKSPEQDAAFWPTIWSMAMAGCGADAWTLLAAHSSYRSLFSREVTSLTGSSLRGSIEQVQRVLQLMPGRSRQSDVVMGTEDGDDWKSWHAECEHLLNTDGYVKATPELTTLLRILLADQDALQRHAGSWYELMMARLFLEEPKRIAHRFEFLMANCYQAIEGAGARMGNFDCIILAVLQYDVQSALQDVTAMGFSWMAAHLGDLLDKGGVIARDVQEETGCSLRERFAIDYALELGATSGMWQFVVGYCEQCPRYGSLVIVETIDREPISTDLKANRLIGYCQGKRLLAKTQRVIAVRRAEQFKASKSYGAALVWLLRAQQFDNVDELCDQILEECRAGHSFTPLNEAVEFLDSSEPRITHPVKLDWLVRYREFNLVLDDRRFLEQELSNYDAASSASNVKDSQETLELKYRFVSAEAAKRLHALLVDGAAPRTLRVHLLEEAEHLLEMAPTVFEAQHLHALLAYFGEIERSFDHDEFSANPSNIQLKSRVEQLALRNLSDAILQDPLRSGNASSPFAALPRSTTDSNAIHELVLASAASLAAMEN